MLQKESHATLMKTAFNSVVRKVVMKSLGQKDFSAQEIMRHLLSLKLVSSSFNVLPISLDGSYKVKTNSGNEDVATNDSLLDVYANRAMYADKTPDIMTLNSITFATKYRLVDKK